MDRLRARGGTESIVGKRQTSVGNFSEAVIPLYARGLTRREIEAHVKEIYGIDISPQFVSRVTEELQQQIVEWQNRPLDRVYPVIFVDGLRVSVRTEKEFSRSASIRSSASTRTAGRRCWWFCGSKKPKALVSG